MSDSPTELTDAPEVALPRAAKSIATLYPELWLAYQRLGEEVGAAGPLAARERRLIHLAYALGSSSEGSAHSHARRALSEGLTKAELDHVALLGVTTLGWPQAMRALAVVRDVTTSGDHQAD